MDEYDSNTLSMDFQTFADLKDPRKIGAALPGWDPLWGPTPDDAGDFFYVRWNIQFAIANSNSQPGVISIEDIPNPGGINQGGELLAWETSQTTPWLSLTLPVTNDPWAEFHEDMQVADQKPGEYFHTVSIYMRYPVSLLQPIAPGSPLRQAMVYNDALITLDPTYDAAPVTKRAIGSLLYEEKEYIPYLGGNWSKLVSPKWVYGGLNRLDTAAQTGPLTPMDLVVGSAYEWRLDNTYIDCGCTYNGSEYGQLPWSFTQQDNTLEWVHSTTDTPSLQKGDYEFTVATIMRPIEHIYSPANALGQVSQLPQPFENYGTSTIHYTLVDNPTPADWLPLGTLDVLSDGTWTYTPQGGTASAAIGATASYAVTLPSGTLGVRQTHEGKMGSIRLRMNLKTRLYPTAQTLAAMERLLTSSDGTQYLPLRNTANLMVVGGARGPVSEYVAESIHLTRYAGSTSISKGATSVTTDPANARERAYYRVTLIDSVNVGSDMATADAVALGLINEQRRGVYYDLLPPGTNVNPSDLAVYCYRDRNYGTRAPYTVSFTENYKGSGRTLMKVEIQLPPTFESNLYRRFTSSPIETGFGIAFWLNYPWDSIRSYGTTVRNYVAYESQSGSLWSGHDDTAPTSPVAYPDAYNDINLDQSANAGEKRFMHAYTQTGFTYLPPLQAGYSKHVKAADETTYRKSTEVPGGGGYTYRLELTTNRDSTAENIVFYDSLEDQFPTDGTVYWQGMLTGVDVSQPRNIKQVDAKVYYATRTVNPKVNAADSLIDTDGNINTALWQPLGTDIPTDVKSVAIDLRYGLDGTSYVLAEEDTLTVVLHMRAPADTRPYLPPTLDYKALAYNNAYVQSKFTKPTGIEIGTEDVSPTTVSLRPIDLTIDKTSNPATGTAEMPRLVVQNSKLTYTLTVKNINKVETITAVQVEDTMPEGLIIDTTGISYRFGTSGAYSPVAGSARVKYKKNGQHLVFLVDQLNANETLSMLIPTTVPPVSGESPITFDNIAYITGAMGSELEVASPPTHHYTLKVGTSAVIGKTFNAGGRALKPNEFSVIVKDASGNQVGGPIFNDAEGKFALPQLWFGQNGTYNYTITEVKGTEGSMQYDGRTATWRIVVGTLYNPTRLAVTSSWFLFGGAWQNTFNFVNTYTAKGHFVPELTKVMHGRPLEAGEFAFTIEAVNGAPLNGENGPLQQPWDLPVRNTLQADGTGAVVFPALHFTQQDIGKVYTYTLRELPSGIPGVTDDNKTITLTLTVEDAGGGQLNITGQYTDSDQIDGNDRIFRNSIETVSYTARKRWVNTTGEGNLLGLRLLQDEQPMSDDYVLINGVIDGSNTGNTPGEPPLKADGSGELAAWAYTWTTLPKYRYDAEGKPTTHVYSAREIRVPDHFQHSVDEDGTLVNTYRPGTFTASKSWNGKEGPEVKLLLYRTALNDPSIEWVLEDTVTLDGQIDDPANEDGSGETEPWHYTWVNLPANTNELPGYTGPFHSFEYEVEEELVPEGYELDTVSTASRLVVNVAQQVDFTVNKVWKGGSEPRPEITLQLTRDGDDWLDAVTLASGQTSHTWYNLPRFSNWDAKIIEARKEYVYAVREIALVGYDTYYSTDGQTITNYFVPPKPAEVIITATKSLAGRALRAGEFAFQLLDSEDTVLQADVRNAADGSIVFNPVRFTAPGEGFVLKVREVSGTDGAIAYDGAVYTLAYDVLLQDDNSLAAVLTSVEKDDKPIEVDSGLTFANTYTPPPPSYPTLHVPLHAKKVLHNATLADGQFTFILRDSAGKELARAVNNADGSVAFPDRSFSRAVSDYTYTITEEAGDDRHIAYDPTVYTVRITTTPVGGRLQAKVDLLKNGLPYAGEILFVNTGKLPATGDSAMQWAVLTAVGALLLLGAALTIRRRRENS